MSESEAASASATAPGSPASGAPGSPMSPSAVSDGRRQRRRSSLAPPDGSQLIQMKGARSGTRSPRRGSQAFLMGDDTIVMQFGDGKRRLSSFCTTSSNEDTIITVDECLTKEEVMETLIAHKQIIANIKTQNWPMHRKLKVLRRAKLYIKKHEGELKQSKQAKDIMAKYKAYMEKSISKFKREVANMVVQLTPWEMRIKKIESQFGSVVASYFTFLRWVFWINTFITIFVCCFLMVPEILRGHDDPTGMRKEVKSQESALTLQAIWDFEGYLKYSPIFYGYYSNGEATEIGYRLPLAYFLATLILILFSFFCILRKMTQTARMNRAGSQDDEYVFSWKLFTGWDYMIGNSETAYNKVASIVMGFKEVILEEKERKKEEKKDWKMITVRVIANFFVLFLLGTSAYAVVLVVERSQDMPESPGWVRENEVTLVVAGVGIVYPNLFSLIGIVEAYHPAAALRWQLARILVLNLLNLYTLMFSLFGKVDIMTAALQEMKYNISVQKRFRMTTETEVTVTVLTERAERMERSLDEEMQAIEGRYYFKEPTRKEEMTSTTTDFMTTVMSTTMANAKTSFSPARRPISTIVKDEYAAGINEFEEDILEGRRRVPAFFRPSRPPSTPGSETVIDPGGRSTATGTDGTTLPSTGAGVAMGSTTNGRRPGTGTRRTTSLPTDATTASAASTSKIKGGGEGPTTSKGTTRGSTTASTSKPSFAPSEDGGLASIEVSTSTSFDADTTTPWRPERGTTARSGCGEDDLLDDLVIDDDDLMLLDEEEKETLRSLCWETMFGQELTKLTVMDFVLTAVSTVIGDFLRAVIVRYCNGKGCFFWDLEKGFPGYSDFPIAENILHLVNNQGMVWLGMFFSPGLPAINTIKLCLMMYLRSWAVLTCNIPHETVFKASGNNFYYALLLLMLFICCLPVGYTCVWLAPSWHCGPFSGYSRVYHILTKYIESTLPDKINRVIDYLTSPGTIIPVILLLVLIIYWLMSTVSNMRDANNDLKSQLRKEKDIPEMSKNNVNAGDGVIPSADALALPEKKHVRISDEIDTNSDKQKLLDVSS